MSANRLRDAEWEPGENGQAPNWERVIVAVLLDIRDRLDVLRCENFKAIPFKLDRIERASRRRCHKAHVKRGKP